MTATSVGAYGQKTSELSEQALAMIARLGGTAERDESLPGKPIVKVDLHSSAVTDADLVLIELLDIKMPLEQPGLFVQPDIL